MTPSALRAIADLADALAKLARAAADEAPGDATAIIPIVEAARIAGVDDADMDRRVQRLARRAAARRGVR